MELNSDGYTSLMKTALDRAKDNDVYAIARLQDMKELYVRIINGKTEDKRVMPTRGRGISVFTKEGTTGFAATSKLDTENIKQMVDLAAKMAKNSARYDNVKRNTDIFHVNRLNEELAQETRYDINSRTSEEAEAIVKDINKSTKSLDDRLSVETIYTCVKEEWRIMRTDGTDVTFDMPHSRILTYLTLKEGEKVSEVVVRVSGLDMSVILEDSLLHLYNKRAKKAANLVSELLNAKTLASGHYKTLLSYEFAGLYAHEAVGHAFETDDMINSIIGIEGRLRKGEKVAQNNISFIDGPVRGEWGNQFISANGVKRNTVEFIKDGVITDALSDVFSARETGVGINGCGRAETYADQPICRMSVTRMVDNNPYPFDKSPDDMTLDDIFEFLVENNELRPGEVVVYPVIYMGGQVLPASGIFVFNCAGIYTLENPKKITLYKQSIFSGDILGALATKAKGVGKVILDQTGKCGKSGQDAPVSIGGNQFFLLEKSEGVTFGGEQKNEHA